MHLKLILKPLVWSVVAFSAYELYAIRESALAPKKHSLASLTFLALLVAIELVLRYRGRYISDRRRTCAHIALMLLKASFALLASCEMNRGEIMMAAINNSAIPQIHAFDAFKAHVLNDLQAELTSCWQSQTVLRKTRQCNANEVERSTALEMYPPQIGGSVEDRIATLRKLHQNLIDLQVKFVCVHVQPDVPSLPDDLDALSEKMGSLELLLLMMRLSSVYALILVTSLCILVADWLLLLLDALWEDTPDSGIPPVS
jgi:hypothetical protein